MRSPNATDIAEKVKLAIPVFAALSAILSAVVATATLYLYVRDRRPRLRVHANNAMFHWDDGTLAARSYDFARRHFFMYNNGNKPVKIEEVRVEFDDKMDGDLPIAAIRLDVDTERHGAPIPGWLDEHYQITSCSADLSEVERLLEQQGYSGPTKVRLIVIDALGNTYGNYFEVLARREEAPMSKMHKVLRNRLRDRIADASPRQGVRVSRGEVETIGEEIDLTPDESIRIFENLGRVAWRGEYEPGYPGWSEAWVNFIGSV